METFIARLKELNAEGRRLFNEYEKMCKNIPTQIEISNKERLYEELGKDLEEKIEDIRRKLAKERDEWNAKTYEADDAMGRVLSEIGSILDAQFGDNCKSIYWSSFEELLESYAPKDFECHPALGFSFNSMVAVAEWDRVEKMLIFLVDWYS